jgi:leader peptidase (prepilin peptidase)/N-methyltransferase
MAHAFALLVAAGCALGAVLYRPGLHAVARYTETPPPRGRVALIGALSLGAVVLACGPHRHLAALLWAAAFAVPLALVDLAVHRLPRGLTYPSAAGTLLLLAAADLAGDRTGSALHALYGALGLWLVFWLMALALPFGRGDATLGLTVGAVLGWYGFRTLFEGFFLGFLLVGLYGIGKLAARRAGRRDELPFGPFLLLGALLAVALSS